MKNIYAQLKICERGWTAYGSSDLRKVSPPLRIHEHL